MEQKLKKMFYIAVFLLGAIAFAVLFLLGRRSIRTILVLILPTAGILLFIFKKWKAGIILFACVIPLYLLTAPGIFAPAFWKGEEVKLQIIKPALQKTADHWITAGLPDTEKEMDFEILSDAASFYYNYVLYKKQNDCVWMAFVSEPDKGCGYARASGEDAVQDMKDLFDEVIPTRDTNWFLVKIWPIKIR